MSFSGRGRAEGFKIGKMSILGATVATCAVEYGIDVI
jgi:hypothetical protein